MTTLLVANRGEIAIRIIEGAAILGVATVAVYPADDADCAHVSRADQVRQLPGSGVAAYTDIDQLLAVAAETGCDAVHPGYGFLSESADFATRCQAAGLVFVGPEPELLALFGDKTNSRGKARELGIPVLEGTDGASTPEQARELFRQLEPNGALMVKALDGGGGRGVAPVHRMDQLDEALDRCHSESLVSGGSGEVYVERLLQGAAHIEVQIVGDGTGAVSHLWERDCSVQRRRQKLIEATPSPSLTENTRSTVLDAAVRLGSAVGYRGVGTVEFLVDTATGEVVFLEVNPRLQVEHPITEEVTGVDLVATQLRIAAGDTLTDLRLEQAQLPAPHGMAIEVRVNSESQEPDGTVVAKVGTRNRFQPPSGRGIRVDTHGYAGYQGNPRYDSLLAKIITHSALRTHADLPTVAARAERALREFDIDGPATNIALLRAILVHPEFVAGRAYTGFVDDNLVELLADETSEPLLPEAAKRTHAKLEHAKARESTEDGVTAHLGGVVVAVHAEDGDLLAADAALVVLESMKMEHVITPGRAVQIRHLQVEVGDTVGEGDLLALVRAAQAEDVEHDAGEEVDLDQIRPDLADSVGRHWVGLDEARPEAVAKRHGLGRRTARENIADLCDPDSFTEYGALAIAAQRQRRELSDLIERTPADGLIAGIGSVNGERFAAEQARCVVMSYDYTVLAGTQGVRNHRKKDRMFTLAAREELPVVLFAEGGGGRPGDTDTGAVASLDEPTFRLLASLSGTVPLVGIVSGRCFAGNAALAGCCDVLIASKEATLGMGGPAMIEGGGLGSFAPEDVGPMDVQVPNGVVDLLAEDDADAVRLARRYLGYFQGATLQWDAADQRRLRHAVPQNRVRAYDISRIIELLADADSTLELRPHFGVGITTVLGRIEGQPVGIVANNPGHLGGAIDHDAADKAARFLQLCNAFGIPIVSLVDTPGFMVGPESEQHATVRKFSRMFVAGANLQVPVYAVVLRKGYGLGAMAMTGGDLKAAMSTVAWPTGEFGGMGLEGAVRLGYRAELEAIDDDAARSARYEELVARMYEQGKALSTAAAFEIDDVIDPADTRAHLARMLATRQHTRAAHPLFVDPW